ncbi:hypothetical protein [Clostridium transplantifaecale]|uniref:hypothetical protein n=1 Tax=Clostridium transplantifaecale TaxID=2479838 RepID=UPI000F6339CC|nr:hypothetical protein [Clostridium transplantifaecale]
MRKEPERLEIDIVKIFLTPPKTMREKITLFVMMVVVFIMFFGPVMFTEISPLKGALLSALPAFTVSWGWLVLLRSLFRKKEYSKN